MRDARRVVARGDPERVGQLVAYLRKGRAPDLLGVDDAIAMLELADYYGVAALARGCAGWLASAVREETALRVMLAAARAALEALEADEVELCVQDLLHAHNEKRPETPRTPSADS